MQSNTPKDEWSYNKMVLDTAIDLNLNLAKGQYREMVLIRIPKKKIRVGYLFYRN